MADRLNELYTRYGGTVHARCRSLLGDGADAEDATQEVFLRIHRYLERVPAEDALNWIYRVATNYCLNELRARKRRPRPAEQLPEPDPARNVEEALNSRASVSRLIEHAKPKVRCVAWLYHVEGFDLDQVATIMGMSRRSVAYRLAEFQAAARRTILGRAAA